MSCVRLHSIGSNHSNRFQTTKKCSLRRRRYGMYWHKSRFCPKFFKVWIVSQWRKVWISKRWAQSSGGSGGHNRIQCSPECGESLAWMRAQTDHRFCHSDGCAMVFDIYVSSACLVTLSSIWCQIICSKRKLSRSERKRKRKRKSESKMKTKVLQVLREMESQCKSYITQCESNNLFIARLWCQRHSTVSPHQISVLTRELKNLKWREINKFNGIFTRISFKIVVQSIVQKIVQCPNS